MPVQVGDRLGHFEILGALGEGGMGQVWRARDTRLHRDVAIKTLPPGFALDADRLARIKREAQLLAALNHPNIGAIYGLEEARGTSLLVLELIEGPTLAGRLARGRVPVREALGLALQLAQALEAAHDKGILHRDLKPSNISLTADGRLKVLDFGLAKALELSPATAGASTVGATATGVIVGTPAYMSPEQARGDVVARQSDIWSFGVVLYEMLTGTSPFRRGRVADTVAQVLEAAPDLARLPRETPESIRRLVRRCLEKDPQRRLQHIGDARVEIDEALTSSQQASDVRDAPPRPDAWRPAIVAAAVLAAGLVGWLANASRMTTGTALAPSHLSLPFPGQPATQPFGLRRVTISPDGSTVVLTTGTSLLIRPLSAPAPIVVSGLNLDPFFSADGRWIAFFRDQQLMKVPVAGGSPTPLAPITSRPGGGAWAADGTIVFATVEGLFEVPAEGDTPRLLVAPRRDQKEVAYLWPSFLPDSRWLLFTIVVDDSPSRVRVALLDRESRAITPLVDGGSSAQYVSTGHLVYASASSELRAVAFDPAVRRPGAAIAALTDARVSVSADNGAADFAISGSGTFVSLPPRPDTTLRQISFVDRRGHGGPIPLAPGAFTYPRISPDGRRLALDVVGRSRDVWIVDLERSTAAQLTDGPTEDLLPLWSRDGKRIFFASDRNGTFDIYSQAADGASGAVVEYEGPGTQFPSSLTPDGRQLVVLEEFGDPGILDLATHQYRLLRRTPFSERLFEVSPDGRWLAYESDESGGVVQIMMRSFPNLDDRRMQVSVKGGRYPAWSPVADNELFYVTPEGEMVVVIVGSGPEPRIGTPTKLFDVTAPPSNMTGRPYDVSPVDGRFVRVSAEPAPAVTTTDVPIVLSWLDRLRLP
jgi:serine/threonine-protein kinase